MSRSSRVVMLLENNPYPQDIRVRDEASALSRAGYDVLVIAPRGPGQPRRDVVDGVRVERFRLPASGGSRGGFVLEYLVAHVQLYARALRQLVRRVGVLHLHNPPDTLFPLAWLARARGARVVYDLHDLFPELFEVKFGGSRVVGLLRAAQRASVRSAHLVIATNESQREIAQRSARPHTSTVVVRNGPRRRTLVTLPTGRPGALEDPHLVFLGTLASQDGIDELPDLLDALRADHGLAGARLTVVGDGPDRNRLVTAVTARGLDAAVRLTGWVAHEQVPALIATADVCVDPAPCSELNHRSTMIKVGEYLAAGRPTVAYDLTETRRTAGEAAVYAPCGDRARFAALVAELAAAPERRADLARQALERAGDLVWEHSERALMEAYGRL